MAYKWGTFIETLSAPEGIKGSEGRATKNVQMNQDAIFLLDNNGQLFVIGASTRGVLGLGHERKIVSELTHVAPELKFMEISLGSNHVLAISEEGQLYAWGDNQYGQLGIGDQTEMVQTPTLVAKVDNMCFDFVLSIENSSFAINEEGDVYAFGDNQVNSGILGLNNKSFTNLP